MRQNSYLSAKQIRWWFPVSDTGFPLEGAKCIDSPILKPRPPKAPRLPNPTSLNSQQPWLDEGIHRTTWFARKAATPRLTPILSPLPDWVEVSNGLKLHAALARAVYGHEVDIKGLWVQLCQLLKTARP